MMDFMEEQLWLAPWYFLVLLLKITLYGEDHRASGADTNTNMIRGAVLSLTFCDMTWFDLI